MKAVKAFTPTRLGDLAARLRLGDASTIASRSGVQERVLGGALVHSVLQTACTPVLTCVE